MDRGRQQVGRLDNLSTREVRLTLSGANFPTPEDLIREFTHSHCLTQRETMRMRTNEAMLTQVRHDSLSGLYPMQASQGEMRPRQR